jgi:hypothetical protein
MAGHLKSPPSIVALPKFCKQKGEHKRNSNPKDGFDELSAERQIFGIACRWVMIDRIF